MEKKENVQRARCFPIAPRGVSQISLRGCSSPRVVPEGTGWIYWEQLDLPIRVTRATQPGIDPTIGGWIVGKKNNLKNAFPELVKVLHPRSEQQRNNWTRK